MRRYLPIGMTVLGSISLFVIACGGNSPSSPW